MLSRSAGFAVSDGARSLVGILWSVGCVFVNVTVGPFWLFQNVSKSQCLKPKNKSTTHPQTKRKPFDAWSLGGRDFHSSQFSSFPSSAAEGWGEVGGGNFAPVLRNLLLGSENACPALGNVATMFMNPLGPHLPSSLDRVNPDPFSVPEKSVYLFLELPCIFTLALCSSCRLRKEHAAPFFAVTPSKSEEVITIRYPRVK